MFHLELREASDRARRLNLTEQELKADVLGPWGRGDAVWLAERAWHPGQAQMTVIEGPEIPVGRLTMGRGWSVAVQEGREVTRELLAAVDASPGEQRSDRVTVALRDALGLEVLRRLREERISLHAVWRLARERNPELAPARSLELATAAVRSLAGSELVLVERDDGARRQLLGEELDAAIDAVEGWSIEAGPAAIWLRRA